MLKNDPTFRQIPERIVWFQIQFLKWTIREKMQSRIVAQFRTLNLMRVSLL